MTDGKMDDVQSCVVVCVCVCVCARAYFYEQYSEMIRSHLESRKRTSRT